MSKQAKIKRRHVGRLTLPIMPELPALAAMHADAVAAQDGPTTTVAVVVDPNSRLRDRAALEKRIERQGLATMAKIQQSNLSMLLRR